MEITIMIIMLVVLGLSIISFRRGSKAYSRAVEQNEYRLRNDHMLIDISDVGVKQRQLGMIGIILSSLVLIIALMMI